MVVVCVGVRGTVVLALLPTVGFSYLNISGKVEEIHKEETFK